MIPLIALKIKVKKKTGDYFLQYKVQDLRLQGKRSTAIGEYGPQPFVAFASKRFPQPTLQMPIKRHSALRQW